MAFEDACRTLATALKHHRTAFVNAIAGVEAMPDRIWYAQVLVSRLLLLYDLQTAGFLGQGDRWYLHTHLGHCQQHQPNSFYKTVLLPLCHQGLGLPEIERPLPLQATFGKLPYLGGCLFHPHFIEQQYPDLDLPDDPFESFLGWLAEQTWHRTYDVPENSGVITRAVLAGALEYLATATSDGKGILSSEETLQAICDRTLDAYLVKATSQHLDHQVESAKFLMAEELDDRTCRLLVETVLPEITILDPACGSGRFLLMALERLQQWYRTCWDYAQQSSDAALQAWVRSLQNTNAAWQLKSHMLTQNLYGVDLRPEAVETTQFQLWLALLSTAKAPDGPLPLPDLDFNITAGNALIGFIRVDEESFDQIAPKRQGQAPTSETVLQGNLLQILAAASYRDALTEKQIRVEHYRDQTKAMAEAEGIPEYVQAEFLRDRIDEVNQAVHKKLNHLLLATFSQKLGIQVREPQASGRTQKRLLTLADIEALRPFHWGFFFNKIVAQQGGFDVILTQPPAGTLYPKADEFYARYAHLFQQHQIESTVFRRSRKTTLQKNCILAKLWATYAGMFSYLRDYFRRSDEYQLPVISTATRSLRLKALFAQRCAALSNSNGVTPYLHDA